MNILIIGGLLGLAVVAVLGAVLLGLSEDRAEKAKQLQPASVAAPVSSEPAASAPPTPVPAAQTRPTVDLGASRQSFPAYPALPAATAPARARPTITLPVSDPGETTSTSLNLADLNGQVSEITDELRLLARRAGELQQRLLGLSEALERQEQSHAGESDLATAADLFPAESGPQAF